MEKEAKTVYMSIAERMMKLATGVLLLELAFVPAPAAESGAANGSPAGQTAPRLSLGVAFRLGDGCVPEPAPNTPALCVIQVVPGGVADRSGIRVGDRLVRIGDVQLTDPSRFAAALAGLKPNDSVEIEVTGQAGDRLVHAALVASDWVAHPAPGAAAPTQIADALSNCGEGEPAAGASEPSQPYRRVPSTLTAAGVDAILHGRAAAVALEGDVLTLAFHGHATRVTVAGSIQCALDLLPGDRWAVQLQSSQWNRRFLSAEFVAADSGGKPLARASATFRGPDAPRAPELAEPLAGSLQTLSLPSRNLGEDRKVTVYLPAGKQTAPLHALFMSDGQSVESFARVLEPLMRKGTLPPLAIVGVHSADAGYVAGQSWDMSRDRRAGEYLPDLAPEAFDKHARFFVEEVVPWATAKFGLSHDPGDRALAGFSNGGSFVQAIGLLHPELFGAILPFSTNSLEFSRVKAAPGARLPQFLFSAGDMEPFLASTRSAANWLKGAGAATTLKTYASGHDMLMWQQAIADLLPLAWREAPPEPVSNGR